MQNIQINFFRQLCQLRKSVSPPIIFREFAERPWLHTWWLRVLGFTHRLSEMPEGSLHLDSLKDNIADARQQSHCTNWAKGITKQFQDLGLRVPFTTSTISGINHLGFLDALTKKQQRLWDNVHESPRTAPSKGAKLCTYHRWFSPPDWRCSSPYYELPMPIIKDETQNT